MKNSYALDYKYAPGQILDYSDNVGNSNDGYYRGPFAALHASLELPRRFSHSGQLYRMSS
jgi:hypothetical protein